MNNTTPNNKWVKRISGLVAALMLTVSTTGQASARILFEDDEYFNVNSEGIIMDYNDNVVAAVPSAITSEGGTYTATVPGTAGDNIDIVIVDGANCDITTPGSCTSVLGNVITITADLNDANGDDTDTDDVTSAMIVAEINAYAPAAALITASAGDGTAVTAGTVEPTGGVDGGAIDLQFGNDGTDASISYDDYTQDLTFSTPGGDIDFSDNNLSTTGAINFQNSSEFHVREVATLINGTTNCTTVGEIVLDLATNSLYVCTNATTDQWKSADNNPQPGTTLNSTLIWNGTAWVENTDFTLNITSSDTGDLLYYNGTDWVDLTQGAAGTILTSDGAGGFTWTVDDYEANTDSQDFESVYGYDADKVLTASGIFNIDAVGTVDIDSDAAVTIGGATIGLTSDSGDVTITAADDIIFDDAQLTGTVQLSDTATDWNVTFSSDGIIDNINSFTSTANGEGASNVGVEDASGWFTGADVEAALNEIEALFGSTTSGLFDFTEDNVLSDNDSVYAALDKLDLKWGDLASTANGEGASLVGIEDSAGNFTATDVEGALTELANDIGNNYEDLTFYPEYPDSTIDADGSNNKGTLESFYDGTAESGYYNWTSTNGNTQDIDIHFAFPMPTDFAATGDFTFDYRTGTTTEADNDVEIVLYNVTDTATCASDLTNGTAGVWATGTITAASINGGCTLDAGDIVEVRIKLYDNNGATDYADVGVLKWDYTK